MIARSVSAPGKLLLCGEYAVLRDAPAVVMAVDRRATVRVSQGNEAWHTVTTPGFSHRTFRFELHDGNRLSWLGESSDTPPAIPAAVIRQDGVDLQPRLEIEIDTRSFVDSGGAKLGLGSSAAATVALTSALLGPDAERAAVWATARQAHEALQGGSGADVAASCFGGLLIFRRDDSALPGHADWPDDLSFRVYFSGKSASTQDAIYKTGSARLPDTAWESLSHAAISAADAWRNGETRAILDAVRAYRDELWGFDRAGIGAIFSAGHDRLTKIGDEVGVVYKPSGAGGGDCGIALADDVGRLDRFDDAAADQGFVTLDIRRDNNGV